jgi:iron complex transport system permease protein
VTGTSAGATLAAVVAIGLGAAAPLVPLAAFVGALAAVTLVWRLARLGGATTVLTVLLAGIVLTSFAGAVVTFLLVSSDRLALRLRAVLGWLQGGVSVIGWDQLFVATLVVATGLVLALVLAHRIDAYAFGEETAATLGVDPDRTTSAVLAATALLSGAAVALAGLVGFVGLVVPHALRFLIGATHRRLVPASFLGGAVALVLADLGARTVMTPAELPVGAITGLVGAPFFLALLVRSRRLVV